MAEPKVLYEDEYLKVVDKPAGMVVNRVEGGPLFAHRLDKETSGCLLIAKEQKVLEKLMLSFKNREVKKEYLAVVHGRLEPREGTIKLPIGRLKGDGVRRAVRVEGRMSETSWLVERHFDNLSLVRLFPTTGRTHQLRVHLSHLGHPIVGDFLYLNDSQRKIDRAKYDRHLLHAAVIEFPHPVTGVRVRVESPLNLLELD